MTRGEHIAEAVRAYLFTNGLKPRHLTGKLVAEIADRALDHLDRLAKKKKRLATEEDWIVELEKEPHLAAINVRKELAACQFWCKNNGKLCTRKRFGNWLDKAVRDVVVSPGGARPAAVKAESTGPKGWLAKLNELFAGSTIATGGIHAIDRETDYQWGQLAPDVREKIRRAM